MFGWLYSDIVLVAYAGQSFVNDSEAVPLLQFFCVYTIFLAFNGITESFVTAGMSQVDLDWHNLFDVGVSIVYSIASIFLANRYSSLGFIYANMLNMAMRIGHSVHWIHDFYKKTNFSPLQQSLPSLPISLWLILVTIVGLITNYMLPALLTRFMIGFGFGLLTLAALYVTEKNDLIFLYELISKKKPVDEKKSNTD